MADMDWGWKRKRTDATIPLNSENDTEDVDDSIFDSMGLASPEEAEENYFAEPGSNKDDDQDVDVKNDGAIANFKSIDGNESKSNNDSYFNLLPASGILDKNIDFTSDN